MHTLILGFDSFDPTTFERLSEQGKMPNLTRYVNAKGYSRLEVSNPPQTEVSWTSIATGLNPGGHGIFDFVHRDPNTYTPYVSLLPTHRSALGVQFVPPTKARTIFEEAASLGYPATSLWWPATFPARPESPVRTIPGLGTPDLLGRLGVGTLFTTEKDLAKSDQKTAIEILHKSSEGHYSGRLKGPSSKKSASDQAASVEAHLEIQDDHSARLSFGKQTIQLTLGKWSPIFEVSFKMGLLFSIRSLTKAILTQIYPEVRLYILPLQIHPLASPWRYATPKSLVKQAWKSGGSFLSLGWPQDTTALEEGCISDEQFIELCDSILADRERVLMHLIDSFDEGVLGCVFDSLDRIQHMFRRDRPDFVEQWYLKLDNLVGRVANRMANLGKQNAKFFLLSDHGFTDFDHKVHLNRWLIANDFLVTTNGNESGGLDNIDWAKSKVYAVGLNSLYVNLQGREGQGSVSAEEYQPLVTQLKDKLSQWSGPDGRAVVQEALLRDDAFVGPLVPYGPDLLVGYAPGYRASSETGLGKWKENLHEPNNDHWGADHCIASQAVPGVLFTNQSLDKFPSPSYRDIPLLTIGKTLDQTYIEPPSISSDEDKEILEERLKGLGYL
jgi:predicted AlkP superfamily phosphohydrolase/phosphomutase